MTKSAKQSKSQAPRFSLDHDGLTEFLIAFQIMWSPLKALYNGPFGENEQTKNFVRRMEQMVRHAEPLLEDGEVDDNSYEKTIKLGAALMRQIEDFIEDIIDLTRVNEFFDRACAEIEKTSYEVWQTRANEILESRARFQQANASQTSNDLLKIVLAYNETTALVNKVKAEAKVKTEAEAARILKEQETRDALARMERNRKRGRSAIAQLSA